MSLVDIEDTFVYNESDYLVSEKSQKILRYNNWTVNLYGKRMNI